MIPRRNPEDRGATSRETFSSALTFPLTVGHRNLGTIIPDGWLLGLTGVNSAGDPAWHARARRVEPRKRTGFHTRLGTIGRQVPIELEPVGKDGGPPTVLTRDDRRLRTAFSSARR